jgi:hypothetical protein
MRYFPTEAGISPAGVVLLRRRARATWITTQSTSPMFAVGRLLSDSSLATLQVWIVADSPVASAETSPRTSGRRPSHTTGSYLVPN